MTKRHRFGMSGLLVGAFLALGSGSSLGASLQPTSPAPAKDSPAATRPNVVVIVTDDQGWADIGYNNPRVYTPTLDRLASHGVVFRQHYVMPQCTPTRVALMTGRYPGRFGGAAMQASNTPAFPLGTPTLGTLFRNQGYETWLIGKWHLGSQLDHSPMQFGFDHSYGSLAGAVGMYHHRYRKGPFEETWHRDGTLIAGAEDGVHATDLVAAEAVRVIRQSHERPFFIYLAFHAPHTPLDERGEFVDRPTQRDEKRPDRWLNEDEIRWFNDPLGLIQQEPDPEKRLFLAAVHHVDDAVRRVVEALEQTRQLDDTLIMFTSDNGPQVNWPGNAYPDDLKLTDFNQPHPWRGHKTDVYEGGIRVPGFWHWTAGLSPGEFHQPTHVVDWFPTLARLIGAASLSEEDGQEAWKGDGLDLWPAVAQDQVLGPRTLYWTWGRGPKRWALRRGEWKLVKYGATEPTVDSWQLFNLETDPGESQNRRTVAGDGADSERRARCLHREFLQQRLLDRDGKRGDR